MIGPVYHPIKAAVRNERFFRTQAEDEDAEREKKYERQRNVLEFGFFTNKTKPFNTVGTVHLNDGELILSALTEDVKAKVGLMILFLIIISCYLALFKCIVLSTTLMTKGFLTIC